MKHDQLLCDLIYLMVPGLMTAEKKLRDDWKEPENLQAVELQNLMSFVLLPKKTSNLTMECILRLPAEGNIGHLKTALCNMINVRRPKGMEIEAEDLCILSGNLELPNQLTMDDVHAFNLGWDLEEREDNQRVFLKLLFFSIPEFSIRCSITE